MTERPSQDALIFRALCVLHEAIEGCRYAPLTPPLPGMRLALSYLYTVSSRDLGISSTDREVFDNFWRTVTAADSIIDAGRDSMRITWAGTHFAGICRRVGVAQTVQLSEALAKAGARRSRQSFAEAVRATAADRAGARDAQGR